MPTADELGLLQGTLDLLVLKTLTWGPRHGYAIARWNSVGRDVDDEIRFHLDALRSSYRSSRART